ncbi:MAG: PVC-type heme-binding CxxCH protein, partial [Planctomycetota bacterium]
GDWNDYRIVAIGPRVAIYINGTLFAELVDRQEGEADLTGSLAFQLHSGPETRIEFREIELETLGAGDDRLGQFKMKRAGPAPDSKGVAPKSVNGGSANFDFEQGTLDGWTATGDAFQNQPVNDDGIARRWPDQRSNKQGDHFIGGFEHVGDAGTGTLTSSPFTVTHPFASYLLSGGRSSKTRVEWIDSQGSNRVLEVQTGNQREQMQRVLVDLRAVAGRDVAIRLVDESRGGWGHLNFDDVRFHQADELVDLAATVPSRMPSKGTITSVFLPDVSASPSISPLLQHLIPNPTGPDDLETLRQMKVPAGFSVELVASEPQLHQPMAFTFDARGRLWVVEGHSYPNKRPTGEGLDRVLIFSDEDGDGSFETRKVFAEGLNLVSGLQVGLGGVWVGAAPELLFIPDRDGDDSPDGPAEVLLDGCGYADTHETLNSFIWGPDGWLYGNQGVFNQSRVGPPGTPADKRVALAAGVWRYHPIRKTFEVFAHGGSNQWGLDYDTYGQWFMTHCRSYWGRGMATHVLQGGHYWNQVNGGHAPFIASKPIDGVDGMPSYLLASARHGHGEGGAGKPGSRAVYGGHSHVGAMIYLGDNWPSKYRNRMFTHNLHGHQLNQLVNQRDQGGYKTLHAGEDVLWCQDPQYVAVDLQVGPDGAVYVSDWYDPRHCHSPHNEQWDRGNGRMYRMRFSETYEPVVVDYAAASDDDLVSAQLHANDWHVRIARLEMMQRAADGVFSPSARSRLQSMATGHDDPQRRLRALWCLHVTGGIDAAVRRQTLSDESEYVRGWTVQLATETVGKDSRGWLPALAESESSLLVRRYLASAAGRVDSETAWQLLEHLASQDENSLDRDLPRLIWQQLAPRLENDLERGLALADSTVIPTLAHHVHWYAAQLSDGGREAVMERLVAAEPDQQLRMLQLTSHALAGTRGLATPPVWTGISPKLYDSGNAKVRRAAEELGAVFGDPKLFERSRAVLESKSASVTAKRHALSLLSRDDSVANLSVLLALLDQPELCDIALQQLQSHRDRRVAEAVLKRLAQWPETTRQVAMETLCSRVDWARSLVDRATVGDVEPKFLTAFYVRQISQLGDPGLNATLRSHWGQVSPTSEETEKAIGTLTRRFKEVPLWAYSRSAGQSHFKRLCANCHEETSTSNRIGPKLEGTGTKGISYIVENILDPNAVIGKDFQARKVLTTDGLVITGVVLKENDSVLTVRTANSTLTIPQDDIEEVIVSSKSFMPEGLLDTLGDRERIELLKYLMSL